MRGKKRRRREKKEEEDEEDKEMKVRNEGSRVPVKHNAFYIKMILDAI
jgi:hypothetical protein